MYIKNFTTNFFSHRTNTQYLSTADLQHWRHRMTTHCL